MGTTFPIGSGDGQLAFFFLLPFHVYLGEKVGQHVTKKYSQLPPHGHFNNTQVHVNIIVVSS